MAKKMQKMAAVIGMMVAMVFGYSCTKFEMEDPGQTTSWAAPKKISSTQKDTWEEIEENFDFFFKYGSFESQVSRPIGAYGEAKKVVTVEAEEYLFGVKYVEGKLDTEKTDWESGRYWVGTQVTRTQNFRLENAKYGADYSDTWFSTNAFFQKDTLWAEFADAEWSREVRLDSTDVYNMSVEGMKGYYKVKDFIATVTNVAKVNEAFIKTLKVAKTSTLKDTLSLRFYVEPDPEDEFVRRWNEVELYEEDKKGVGEWKVYEEWSVSGIREVHKENVDFNADAEGNDNNPVYPTNTAYQISSEKWNGTGNKAIATTSSNGVKDDEFKTNFRVYGDKSVTLTYKDQSVTFNTQLVQETVKQTISEPKLTLINGVYYNISLYTAEILPVYTVTCGDKSISFELSAKGETQLRAKTKANIEIENQDFKANFKAEGAKLYHEDGEYANLWDIVTYTEGVETDRKPVVRNLYLNGNVNGVDSYEVEDASMLGQLKLSSIKGNANSTSKKDGNFVVKTTVATVTATFDNGKTQTIDFKLTDEKAEGMSLGYATIDFAKLDKSNCKIDTVRVNETTMQIVPKYTVPVVITKIDGKTETKSYVIYNPFYETVKAKPQDKVDTTHTPSVANGQLIMLVERVVNDKDRTEIRTDKCPLNFGITAQNAKDIYGKDYATTYNGTRNVQTTTNTNGYWTVESVKGQVTSTLSNGSDSDDNIADYGFDRTITYKDGDYSYTWIGKMDLSDKANVTDAGYKTINDVYYKVSDYQENFNGVYSIDGEEIGKPSDAVKRQILEAETVVDKRSERVVSKKNNGYDITTNFYYTYSFRGEKLVKTENGEITFNYSSRSHSDMIAASATGYKTTSNGVSGSTYSNTLSNGTNSTNNVYDITLGTTKIVHTFDGMSETYEAVFSAAEVSSSVATNAVDKTVDGVNYNAYAYSNTTKGTLSLDGQNVTKEASTSYDILVKKDDVVKKEIENKKYEAIFETSGANLTTKVNANSWDNVTYTNGVETGRETVTHNLKVEANISGGQPFAVDSKENLNKEYKITSISRTGNQVTTVTEDGVKKERTIQNFNATMNNGQTLKIEVTTEKDLTEGMTLSHTYCETVKAAGVEASVSGNTVTLTPKVNVMLVEDNGVSTKAATGAAKAYTIESSMVGTYTPETTQEYEPEVVNGRPVVHEYDVTDGVRTFKQDYPYTPNKNLVAQSAKDMYGENYSTVYNGTRNITTSTSTNGYWTVENTKGQVYSTLSNGVSSDENIADYGYDSKMTFKKGNYSYTFVGTVALSNSTDALKDAGTKTISGITYNVSDYKENFNMVYTIDGTTIDNLSDAVKRQILVEVEIEDLVPGTILAVNVRAVAAVWNGSKYVNADGHLDKIKGLAIVTKEHKGAYIPFAAASADVALPSDEEIKNANYVEKDYYNSDYVAGYDTNKNGNWQLATVEDRSNQIVYFDNGTAVRSLTQKSMNTWNWTSAEQTSQVGGYKIEVKDGVCTVYFNDKLVKIFK